MHTIIYYNMYSKCRNFTRYQEIINYNHFHNILRRLGVLTNSPFTTSETTRDYYL